MLRGASPSSWKGWTMAHYNGNGDFLFYEMRGRKKEREIDIDFYYNFWQGNLFERLMRLFIYKGWMPYPQRELEKRLLRSGVCAEVNDPKVGLLCTYGALSGVTEYYDMFRYVTYANPISKSGMLTIGKNAVVWMNNSTFLPVNALIDKHASILAHINLTTRSIAINNRAQDILLASNESTRDTLNEWYENLYRGKPSAIMDKSLFSPSDSVANLGGRITGSLLDAISAETEALRGFYRDIGVRFAKDKRSNTVTDEVTSDEQMLLFNIDDMLKCREEGCEEHNRVFASRFEEINAKSIHGYKFNEYVPLTVELNPLFEIISSESEVSDDGQSDINNQ